MVVTSVRTRNGLEDALTDRRTSNDKIPVGTVAFQTGATANQRVPDSDVVIVANWNGQDLPSSSLRSLRRQSNPLSKIMLINTVPTDRLVASVRRTFPLVRITSADTELAYAENHNQRLRHARGD